MNLDSNGVKIYDPRISWVVHIEFTQKGMTCEICHTNKCKHIQFALTQEKIQETIRQRRKEGWNLPDI